MEEKLKNEKGEISKKTKERKAKAAIITLSTVAVLFVGLQVYASTNGYGNVFFMIKNLITTGNPAGAQEIFSDQDITLSYKSIKLAEGLKIQVNRLEIKEEQSILYLNIVKDNNADEMLPLTYALDVKRPDGNGGYIPIMRSIIPNNKFTGKTSQDLQYIDTITIGEKLQGNETISLHITDKNNKDLRTLEINLENREITVTGEEEISKISQIELKKYLSIFSQLNNGSLEEAQLIRMAYDIYDMNFPEKEKKSSLEEINQTIKEFYGNKAIFETVTPPADTRGGEYESLKLPKDCMISPSYQANGYIMDTDMTDYQIGLCLKINDISYENGIYTVKYIYTLYRDAYVKDNEIENQPQYETTIKLKRNEDAKYSKYEIVSLEKGKVVKERVETSVVEESKKQQITDNTNNIKYEISIKDEIYATIKAGTNNNTRTQEFKMNGAIADTGTMNLPVIGNVALVAYTGGEYYGINVYQLVNGKIENIGTINCSADMVKEATYEVTTKGEATAVITAKRNGEKTSKEFKMNAAIARTDVIDVLKCGKVVLVAETGGEYYAFRVFRLSQDYTTGKTKEIVEVGRIQQTGEQLEPDNYAEEVVKDEIKQKVLECIKKDPREKLDCKVEEVQLIDKNNYPEGYSTNDYLAIVYYSVKPQNINNTKWIAANGTIEGEWIKNKMTCVRLSEGKLEGFGCTSF